MKNTKIAVISMILMIILAVNLSGTAKAGQFRAFEGGTGGGSSYSTGTTSSNTSSQGQSTDFIGDAISSSKKFLEQGNNSKGSIDPKATAKEFTKGIQPIGTAIISLGAIIAVLAAIILGVRYFMAAADPKKQAEVKDALIVFVIATSLLVLAYPLFSFIVKFIGELKL